MNENGKHAHEQENSNFTLVLFLKIEMEQGVASQNNILHFFAIFCF